MQSGSLKRPYKHTTAVVELHCSFAHVKPTGGKRCSYDGCVVEQRKQSTQHVVPLLHVDVM